MEEDEKPTLVECYKRMIKALMDNESIHTMFLLENVLEQVLTNIKTYRTKLVDSLLNDPDYDYEKAVLEVSKTWETKEKENDI